VKWCSGGQIAVEAERLDQLRDAHLALHVLGVAHAALVVLEDAEDPDLHECLASGSSAANRSAPGERERRARRLPGPFRARAAIR
jgi:hypothetical protein